MSYTYAILRVPQDYERTFHNQPEGEVIDMNGIALAPIISESPPSEKGGAA